MHPLGVLGGMTFDSDAVNSPIVRPRCGRENASGNKFFGACGQSLTDEDSDETTVEI